MKFLCPQIQIQIPLGIENESTRTLAHAYSAYGLSRDGSLPKAIHVGDAKDAAASHFILFPGGKQVDLSFSPTMLDGKRVALECLESAMGYDRKHYQDKKDSVDQKTPLARFFQDQIMEVWDPVLEAKAKDSKTGQPVLYKDLLKFWDDGVGDANTTTLNLSVLMTMLEYIEHKDDYLTVHHLVAEHDKTVALSLQKGAVVCRAEDWGKTFFMNDQKEHKVACERPENLADLARAVDANRPTGIAQVTPDSAQGVLNVMGYANYKAIPMNLGLGIAIGGAVGIGVLSFLLGRRSRKNKPENGPAKTPAQPSPSEKLETARARTDAKKDAYKGVLEELGAADAPADEVLAALAGEPQAGARESNPPPPPAPAAEPK